MKSQGNLKVRLRRSLVSSTVDSNSFLPADTPFKQQKLKAWQPILTPNWVIGTFAIVGLIFIPIGVVLNTESDNVRVCCLGFKRAW